MGPAITATVFGAFAVIAAYVLRPRFTENPSAMRAAIFWLVTTPIMFTLPSLLGALVLCAMALIALKPKGLDDRAAFYFMTLVAIPSSLAAAVPFPGLNYLLTIDFAMIACLVLLMPVVLFGPGPGAAKTAPATGIFMIALTVLYCIQEFRDANFTSGLRACVEDVLLYALPFMALIRLIRTRHDFEKMLTAFAFIAMVFFFAAFISQFTKWNFYTFVTGRFGFAHFADYRYGILRVSVTVNTVVAGYMMLLGLLAVEYYRRLRLAGFMMSWVWRGLFLLTAFFTFSRGAWLAMAVGLATFFLFTRIPRGLRPVIIVSTLIFGAPFALSTVMTADLSVVDEFSSFEYRRELIKASMIQISENPLFGVANFRESPNLAHLVQGQGIIDIVNHYLSVAMEHGLVGLGLYLGAFGSAIAGLLGVGRHTEEPRLELQRAVLLGAIAGYLVLIATTSAVSLVTHFGVLVLALSAAFIAAARAEFSQKRAEASPAPDSDMDIAGGALAAIAADEREGDLYGQ